MYGCIREDAKTQLKTKETETQIVHKNRIIKYFERGLNLEQKILYNLNFALSEYDTEKLIRNKRQKYLYKITNNLSTYPNSVSPIDFTSYFHLKSDKILKPKRKDDGIIDDLNQHTSTMFSMLGNIYKTEISKKYSSGILFKFVGMKSIYIPCKFIRFEEPKIKEEFSKSNVLEIYFEITNDTIVKFLSEKLSIWY